MHEVKREVSIMHQITLHKSEVNRREIHTYHKDLEVKHRRVVL